MGIYDNFFELGGHSLKAVNCIRKFKEFGLQLEVRDLFVYPVVEELALNALQHIKVSMISEFVNLMPMNDDMLSLRDEIEANYNVDRNVDSTYSPLPFQNYFLSAEEQLVNFSSYRIQGNISDDEIIESLRKIMQAYSILRTGYNAESNKMLEYTSPVEKIPYYDCTDDKSRSDLLKNMIFNIYYDGELLLKSRYLNRIFLTKESESEYILRIFIHHSVYDGSSVQQLRSIISEYLNGVISENVEIYSEFVNAEANAGLLEDELYLEVRNKFMVDKTEFIQTVSGIDRWTLHIELPSSHYLYSRISENPITESVKLISIFSDFGNLSELPFSIVSNSFRRESGLGLYLDLIPGIYNRKNDEFVGALTLKEHLDNSEKNWVLSRDDFKLFEDNGKLVSINYLLDVEMDVKIDITSAVITHNSKSDNIVQCSVTDNALIMDIPLWSSNVDLLIEKVKQLFKCDIKFEDISD